MRETRYDVPVFYNSNKSRHGAKRREEGRGREETLRRNNVKYVNHLERGSRRCFPAFPIAVFFFFFLFESTRCA